MALEALCGYGNVAGEKAGALWYRCGERRRLEPRGGVGPAGPAGREPRALGGLLGRRRAGALRPAGVRGTGGREDPKFGFCKI